MKFKYFKQFILSSFIFVLGLSLHTMFLQNQILNQEIAQSKVKENMKSTIHSVAKSKKDKKEKELEVN